MTESLLKKEFNKSTVQRCRNLISGNYGASTQIVVGYEKTSSVDHEEGDTWEENGKAWIIKNGLKRSVGKLSKAREYAIIPWTCPHCGKVMNSEFDRKMYKIHGMCSDCTVKMEDDLKRAGLYSKYEKSLILGNVSSFVQELQDRIEALNKDVDTKIATEDGLVEDWGRISNDLTDSLKEWKDMLVEKLS